MFKDVRFFTVLLCLAVFPSLAPGQRSTSTMAKVGAQQAIATSKAAAASRSVPGKDENTVTRHITVRRKGVSTRYTQEVKLTKVSKGSVKINSQLRKSLGPGAKSITIPFTAATGLVHPAYGGPPNTTVASQDFGRTSVGGQSVVETLTYTAPTSDTSLTFNLSGGIYFSLQPAACTATQCTVVVTFTPTNPGRLNDALSVTDSNGNLLDQTFLSGIGTGPQLSFQFGTEQLLDYAATAPSGAAFGPDGSYYAVDPQSQTVTIGAPSGQVKTISITGLCDPSGMAVNGSGTIYIADPTFNRVVSYSSLGVESIVQTTPLLNPSWVAVDGTGALYISDTGNGRIIKIDNHNTETTILSGLPTPEGIAVDAAGDLFFADQQNGGEVKELQASGGQVLTLTTGLGNMRAIATDASGRIFYTTTTLSGIYNNATEDLVTFENDGEEGPYAIAVAPDGRILTTQPDQGIVITLASSGQLAPIEEQINTTTQSTQTIANSGNSTLTFSSVTTQGPAFTIDPNTQCNPEIGLAAGSTCDVQVDFTPTQVGDSIDNLTATSNSLNAPGTRNQATLEGIGEPGLTQTTLTVSPINGPAGATITFTAVVAQQISQGLPAPTGSVTFEAYNTSAGTVTTISTVTLSGSPATAVVTSNQLASGSYVFNAVYAGDTYNQVSVSNEISSTVGIGTGSSSVQLTAAATTIALNQPDTLTFTITGQGSATPTGTISFTDDDLDLGTAQLTGTGNVAIATFTPSNLTGGQNRIYAYFAGDATYAPIYGGVTVNVTPGPSATALTINPASATTTQAVSLTATIATGASPAEDGQVVFSDQNGPLGTVYYISQTSTGGTATLTQKLALGTHQITAHFTDDEDYTDSTSPAQTVVITPGSPALNLTVSAANINVGQTEILTLVIGSLENPAQTGTVTFSDQNGVLGTATVCLCEPYPEATLALSTLTAGVHQITATYNGDSNYAAATSNTKMVTVGSTTTLAPTTTALTVSPTAITVGQQVTLTASVTGTSAPPGIVTFSDATGPLGTATLGTGDETSQATLTLSTLDVGVHQIEATYAGNTTFAPSVSPQQTVTVAALGTQVITFPPIPNHNVGDGSFSLAAIASSGLPVTYTVLSGPATVSGSLVTLTGAVGTVVIQASQIGNATIAAATPVTQSFTVTLTIQLITFPAISNHVIGDAPFNLAATASSGLPVLYAVLSGPATVSGSLVTLTGTTGTVVIQASQAGDATHAAATPINQSFTVTLAPVLSLTSVSPNSGAIGSPATTITLTGTDFSTSDIVLLNGTTLPSTYVGPTTLTATLPASFFANAGTALLMIKDTSSQAVTVGVPFTVSNAPQIIFTGPTTAVSGQQPSVTFQLVNPYPVDLAGMLSLTFAPSTSSGINDPNVQFASGGRTLAFNIPADSTTTPAIQLQTGTVAGTATISLAVMANGIVVTPTNVAPITIVIPAAIPTITSTKLTRSGDTLTISVVGYSNTREAIQATFHFNAVPGSTIDNPDVMLTVGTNFAGWYVTPASDNYGSAFTYTQDFTLDQASAIIQDVTVTLANTVGASAPATTP